MKKRIAAIFCVLLVAALCLTACEKKDPGKGAGKSVKIFDSSVDVLVGTEYELSFATYVGTQAVSAPSVTWTSSNPAVATVDGGVITAVSGGLATVTAAYGTATASADVFVAAPISAENVNTFDDEYINIFGRTYVSGDNSDRALNMDHVLNAVEIGIVGTSLSVDLTADDESYMRVFVDGDTEGERIKITEMQTTYTVAENLSGGYHKIRLVKTSEEVDAKWDLTAFSADGFATVRGKSDLKIEFIGDSLTTGYAVLGSEKEWDPRTVENSDGTKAFAYLTAQALGADYSAIAINGICTKAYHWRENINMDTLYRQVSMTNTAEYAFDFAPDVIVLNLGSNEASYLETGEGKEYDTQFPIDYTAFLTYVREKNPNAHIICLLGEGTSNRIQSAIEMVFEDLQDSNIVFNPFTYLANDKGLAKHPSMEAQATWAVDLAAYIQGLH